MSVSVKSNMSSNSKTSKSKTSKSKTSKSKTKPAKQSADSMYDSLYSDTIEKANQLATTLITPTSAEQAMGLKKSLDRINWDRLIKCANLQGRWIMYYHKINLWDPNVPVSETDKAFHVLNYIQALDMLAELVPDQYIDLIPGLPTALFRKIMNGRTIHPKMDYHSARFDNPWESKAVFNFNYIPIDQAEVVELSDKNHYIDYCELLLLLPEHLSLIEQLTPPVMERSTIEVNDAIEFIRHEIKFVSPYDFVKVPPDETAGVQLDGYCSEIRTGFIYVPRRHMKIASMIEAYCMMKGILLMVIKESDVLLLWFEMMNEMWRIVKLANRLSAPLEKYLIFQGLDLWLYHSNRD